MNLPFSIPYINFLYCWSNRTLFFSPIALKIFVKTLL